MLFCIVLALVKSSMCSTETAESHRDLDLRSLWMVHMCCWSNGNAKAKLLGWLIGFDVGGADWLDGSARVPDLFVRLERWRIGGDKARRW